MNTREFVSYYKKLRKEQDEMCFATFFIIKLPFRFLTFSIVNFI